VLAAAEFVVAPAVVEAEFVPPGFTAEEADVPEVSVIDKVCQWLLGCTADEDEFVVVGVIDRLLVVVDVEGDGDGTMVVTLAAEEVEVDVGVGSS
jgi:hypothetical protein